MDKSFFFNTMFFFAIATSSAHGAGINNHCTGYETFKFSDKDINNVFVKKLVESDVAYSINVDGSVATAPESQCEFNAILEVVSNLYMPPIGFSIPDSSLTNAMLARFTNENIDVKHVVLRERVIFSFSNEKHRVRAEDIFEKEFKNRVYEEAISKTAI